MNNATRVTATRHVLAVNDLAASTAHFVDVLGFTRDFCGVTPDGHRMVFAGAIS